MREISRDEKRRNGQNHIKWDQSVLQATCCRQKRPRGLLLRVLTLCGGPRGLLQDSAPLCSMSLLSIPVSLSDLDMDIHTVEFPILHKQSLFGKSQPWPRMPLILPSSDTPHFFLSPSQPDITSRKCLRSLESLTNKALTRNGWISKNVSPYIFALQWFSEN